MPMSGGFGTGIKPTGGAMPRPTMPKAGGQAPLPSIPPPPTPRESTRLEPRGGIDGHRPQGGAGRD